MTMTIPQGTTDRTEALHRAFNDLASDPDMTVDEYRYALTVLVLRCHNAIDAIDQGVISRPTETDIWTTSASADEYSHDQEVDLGDGWHLLVYPRSNGADWGWELWDQWMHSNEDGEYAPLEGGITSSENTAKAAALIAAAHRGRFPR